MAPQYSQQHYLQQSRHGSNPSVHQQMNRKRKCTHTHTHIHTMEYYPAIKKNEILPFVAIWMDLANITPRRICQSQQILYDTTYMWNLKHNINDYICKTETDSQIQKINQQLPKGRGKGGGAKQGYGIKRYKLLCIKQISNKDILYSTGNYSHYLIITFNGV